MTANDQRSLPADITSEAFARAQLASERTRTVGFLIALALLLAIVVGRTLLVGETQERELLARCCWSPGCCSPTKRRGWCCSVATSPPVSSRRRGSGRSTW